MTSDMPLRDPNETQQLADERDGRRTALEEAVRVGPPVVELTRIDDLAQSDVRAWAALAELAAEPNPWYEAAWVLHAARCFPDDQIQLMTIRRGPRWLFALPLITPHGSALVGRGLLVAWRHRYSSLTTPLVDRENVDWMADVFARSLAGRLVLFRQLGTDGPFAEALHRLAESSSVRVETFSEYERATVRWNAAGAYRLEHCSGHRAKDTRRCQRAITRDFGSAPVVIDRSLDREALEEFLELEGSGWKGTSGTAILANGAHATLFREVSEDFRRAGRLELLALQAGGQTLAMQWNVRAGATVFGYKVAYDESLSRYSPGVVLEYLALDRFQAAGEGGVIDSCTSAGNRMMNEILPDRRRVGAVGVYAGVRGRVVARALRSAYAIKARRGG